MCCAEQHSGQGTRYTVIYRGESGWPADNVVLRLRLALKHALRSYGLRAVKIEPTKPAGVVDVDSNAELPRLAPAGEIEPEPKGNP